MEVPVKVWKHANLTVSTKLEYFHSLIISRLLYGLTSVWLAVAQRRRIDGFYARCLRQVLRIPPAFVSRISNAVVLQRAGRSCLSSQLLHRQLVFLGRVARKADADPLRRDTFATGTFTPQLGRFIGRVGRPRQDWTRELMKAGAARMGAERFEAMLSDRANGAQSRWKQEWQKLLPSRCGVRST